MKLWLVERTDEWGYDDHDAAVVAAESEFEAREIQVGSKGECWSTWTSPENVKATLIGEASEGIEAGVILESFNAG